MTETIMKDWEFKTTSEFVAPECSSIWLYGKCYGHPKLPDGTKVATCVVALHVKRRMVVSASGRIWKLLSPKKGTQMARFAKAFGAISFGRMASLNPLLSEKARNAIGLENAIQ